MIRRLAGAVAGLVTLGAALGGCTAGYPMDQFSKYPWHTQIVATTFWVGEIFDPNASDGSQVISTYDGSWERNYGGCDGVVRGKRCETERRIIDNGYFPLEMTPKQNPFYLDLPFDDINNARAFSMRNSVVPWASTEPYASHDGDRSFSFMKNRWVVLSHDGNVCFGQIEDAGPGRYDDHGYVFGHDDRRPANTRYNNAGLDVSPALNGCLGFSDLNGDSDRVDWAFVDTDDVPNGPWTRVVTTSQVSE